MKRTMKRKGILAVLISAGALLIEAGPSASADGILFSARAGDSNYCHLKFPAIREDTLSWNRPVLQNPSTGPIIDFYGPCDYDPTGKEAVADQKRFMSSLRRGDFGD